MLFIQFRNDREELKQQRKKLITEKKQNATAKSTGPSVVVFDGSVLQKKPTLEDKASKKRFLVRHGCQSKWISDWQRTQDSRITTADPLDAVEQKSKPTAKDIEEEA